MSGCCHRIVKHWPLLVRIYYIGTSNKLTTCQLQVKQDLSQKKKNYLENIEFYSVWVPMPIGRSSIGPI